MKLITNCLILLLACLSCHINQKDFLRDSSKPATSHEEILKNMRQYWIREIEVDDKKWLLPEEIIELNKMKQDFYYELSDQNLDLTIPGPSWSIRGPLTIEQVEKESIESLKENPRKDIPQVPFAYGNDRWKELKSKYVEGDKFYFYGSDKESWRYSRGRSGYVLVRNNMIIGDKGI
jgi:hypothetical protein